MQLKPEEIRHIANMAKLKLTDAEVEKYTKELSSILTHLDVLDEIDVTGVKERIQGVDQENVMVSDEIIMCDVEKELVACTPHEVEDNMISIPKIM